MAVYGLVEILRQGAFIASFGGVAIALWSRNRSYIRTKSVFLLLAVVLEATGYGIDAPGFAIADDQGTLTGILILAFTILWQLGQHRWGHALHRERAKLTDYWSHLSAQLAKRSTALFTFDVSTQAAAIRLADALSQAGFESPRHTASRRWSGQNWTVVVGKPLEPPVTQEAVILVLERAISLGESYGARFRNWAATTSWP